MPDAHRVPVEPPRPAVTTEIPGSSSGDRLPIPKPKPAPPAKTSTPTEKE